MVIDPTGPYADDIAEGTESVWLNFFQGGPAVAAQQVMLFQAQPANSPPTFIFPAGKTRFEFFVGEGAPEDPAIFEIQAQDADGDPLKFMVEDGINPLFKVGTQTTAAGVTTLTVATTRDMRIGAEGASRTFRVYVSDGNVWWWTKAEVVVTYKPMVVVSGDLYGVEAPAGAKRDTIRLDFRRISADMSGPLTITYGVDWGTVDPTLDLTNPAALAPTGAQVTRASLTFGRNVSVMSIVLTPTQDGVREGMETFTVTIITPTANTYCVTGWGGGGKKFPSVSPKFYGYETVTVSVLDAVTLFGAENDDQSLEDNDPVGGPLGLDLNDIRQRGVPNCFFMSAIGALAQREPTTITRNIRLTRGGQAEVTFYPTVGGPAVKVVVDMTIDDNAYQAQLTGDWRETPTEYQYEIWPLIYEKASAKCKGFPNGVWPAGGSFSYQVWQELTGRSATWLWTINSTPAQLSTLVRRANLRGQKIVLTTYSGAGGKVPDPASGVELVGGHAYVLDSVDATWAYVYNPHGKGTHTRVLLTELSKYFYGFQWQDSI